MNSPKVPYSSPYKNLSICLPDHEFLKTIVKIDVHRGPGSNVKLGDHLLSVETGEMVWELSSPFNGIVNHVANVHEVTSHPRREIAQLLYIPMAPNQVAQQAQKKPVLTLDGWKLAQWGIISVLGTASLIMLGFIFFYFSYIYEEYGVIGLGIALVLWLALMICCL